ncbi:MazG-like protein [Paenibacillus sp. FSL R7-0204]|uniref:MazG-like protein n=1 Tax=Paenibacillus sp. FSL R7-0204 TaxID=2921675 RepID=UPI0030F6B009
MDEMKKGLSFKEMIERSLVIRERYHRLEQHHGTEWSVEEDALAFLTDAALVGRLTMSEQKRWPKGGDTRPELEHKLSECIWWLIILSERMEIDISESMEVFLSTLEKQLRG